MKALTFSLLAIVSAATAVAAPPEKKPVSSYSQLWTSSPFTAKPPPPESGPVISAFDDWALGGVSEVEGGYMVTLFHKKNAGETQVIKPRGTVVSAKDEMKWLEPGAPEAFKVTRVEYGKTTWKETLVHLSAGGKSGTVKFDDKLLAPTASAAPAGQNRPAGQPGQPNQPAAQNPPGVPTPQTGPGGRPPRQRVLPPAPNQNQNQRPNR